MFINFDNIIFSLQKSGGISIYWAELSKRFKKNTDEIFFYERVNSNIFRSDLTIVSSIESMVNIKILRYLPFMKIIPSKSIFHSSYYRISLQKNIVNITTVHDFTYEYFRKGVARYIHLWQKGFAIKRSDGIICVSKNTKKDLMRFYPDIEESKLKVIYNGVGDEFKKLNSAKDCLTSNFEILKNKKYILYIGDRSNYKNFNIAIEVLSNLEDYSFVVIGGSEFSHIESGKMMSIKNRTYHFRGVKGDALNIIYNNAFCLLYPSSYEGFGIPIIEAMKSGCPVVSVNVSSIPEVAGNAGLLTSDIDTKSFIKEIKKLEENKFRKSLINKGFNQANKFSWDKCFNETYNFYQEVYDKKFGE
jgi:glycosyltransferase involved in cell wall biosynthesis